MNGPRGSVVRLARRSYKRAMALVAPSILAADLGRLAEEVAAVEHAGADWIHVDVMDGHFVPNLTMGPDVVRAVRRATNLPIDVHLMVTDPLEFIEPFAAEGATHISFHREVVDDVEAACARVREAGAKAGLVINPPTPVESASPFLASVDYMLVMSVNPGFAGQAFIPAALPKLRTLAELKKRFKSDCLLEIDGGIKIANAADARAAGADVLVSGSGIFGERDYAAAIAAMRQPR
jgi:ribulose-phosphate 3-epimerase